MEAIINMLEKIRTTQPLIHNITNVVVTQFTANGLYALGALPVMANSKKEVAEMARMAKALVLNIGTLNDDVVEAMILAGRSANEQGIPVIFDPVGVGATAFRTQSAKEILSEVKVSMIRGNAAEVANLIGEKWVIHGVDAENNDREKWPLAKMAAQMLETNVTITGKDDIITNGHDAYIVQNGHPMLTKVTGTGCLLSSVIGAFAAIEEDPLKAGLAAVVTYGVAAEIAFIEAGKQGPGSFQIELLNQLYNVSSQELRQLGRYEYATL